MFAADLTELARNDGGWAQLRQVRCNVFARYLSDFAAIRTRHQEARTLVVVILYTNNNSSTAPAAFTHLMSNVLSARLQRSDHGPDLRNILR